MTVYLSDHQDYLAEMEKMSKGYRQVQLENDLLIEYNQELTRQIE